MSPKVTVYIVSHNYGEYLEESIESVLRQNYDSWELLLINNGSMDQTDEIIERYATDPKIRVYRTNNIGLPNVANLALKEAKGKYLIRLDADDVFDDNILLILSNILDRDEDIVLVYPSFFLMDEKGMVYSQHMQERIYYKNHMLDLPANGACTMIRTYILSQIGGYREDLGVQDGFDLWTKVIKKHKCANVPIPLFYYRRHGLNLTENCERIVSARRIIKRDAFNKATKNLHPVIAVILCRKYYDIYPDLWSQKVNGKTLLDISIQKCLNSALFDQIVVTADNLDVQECLKSYDDKRLIFVERTKYETINTIPVAQTLEKVARRIDPSLQGVTVLAYLQAPLASTETLEEAVYTLVVNDANSSIAVNEVHEQLFKRTAQGLMPLQSSNSLTSDFDAIYSDCRVCIATKNSNLRTGSLFGTRIVHYVISREEAFFIHTKQDIRVLRTLFDHYETRTHSDCKNEFS